MRIRWQADHIWSDIHNFGTRVKAVHETQARKVILPAASVELDKCRGGRNPTPIDVHYDLAIIGVPVYVRVFLKVAREERLKTLSGARKYYVFRSEGSVKAYEHALHVFLLNRQIQRDCF